MSPILQPAEKTTPTPSDLALGASLLVVALLSGSFVDAARPDTVEPSAWWHWVLICTPAVLVAVRRVDPIVIAVGATVAQVAIWVSDLPEVLLSMIVILYSVSSEAGSRGLRVAVGCSAVLTAVTIAGVGAADDVTLYQVPLIVLTCGTAIALGVAADRQRTTSGELASQVAEMRLRSEFERVAAAANERSHITRELHDIVGHSLSTIAVRAEAADRVAERNPAAARDAVVAIAAAARSSLTEIRQVLAGLRDPDHLELEPPRDLEAIERLVDELVDAGVAVTFTADGCDGDPLPAVVASGAHRIVQESLTNVVRHAGPSATATVALVCGPDHLDVLVVDDGPGGTADARAETGAGLAGMAERAAVLGGTFEAGNRPAGGFVVHAVLPTSGVTS